MYLLSIRQLLYLKPLQRLIFQIIGYLIFLLSSYEERKALRLHLESVNIETRPLWKPLNLQPIFKQYPYYGLLISEDLFNRGLSLPSGSNLSNNDLTYIKDYISLFFDNKK